MKASRRFNEIGMKETDHSDQSSKSFLSRLNLVIELDFAMVINLKVHRVDYMDRDVS
jgi:hypothetical protein